MDAVGTMIEATFHARHHGEFAYADYDAFNRLVAKEASKAKPKITAASFAAVGEANAVALPTRPALVVAVEDGKGAVEYSTLGQQVIAQRRMTGTVTVRYLSVDELSAAVAGMRRSVEEALGASTHANDDAARPRTKRGSG